MHGCSHDNLLDHEPTITPRPPRRLEALVAIFPGIGGLAGDFGPARKVTLLVIPLLIVMAARDQQAEILFVGGVKLLNLVATILNNLLAATSV